MVAIVILSYLCPHRISSVKKKLAAVSKSVVSKRMVRRGYLIWTLVAGSIYVEMISASISNHSILIRKLWLGGVVKVL
ncbi:MAG: hypothetical protein ACQJCO_05775 [cyanobacterium endosymbiont of Rhopalodia sterrenbergii]